MKFCLSLKLPEDLSHVALARRVSRDALCAFGVGSQDVDDIEILIGELATNAVCHAHNDSYDVEVMLMGDKAIVTVTDQGTGFSRDQVPLPGTARPNLIEGGERIGGWGLPLVETLADHVEFRPNLPHGTTVRVEKRLHEN